MSKRHPIGMTVVAALAAAALMPAAASAEAPHIYKNGALASSTPFPIVSWSSPTITLEAATGGPITCLNEFFGRGWNPEPAGAEHGPAGRGEIVLWSTGECKAPGLEELTGITHLYVFGTPEEELEPAATAGQKSVRRKSSLPWKTELEKAVNPETEETVVLQRVGLAEYGESGTGRSENTKCYPAGKKYQEVPAGCIVLNIVAPQALLELMFFGTNEPEGTNGVGNGLTASRFDIHFPTEQIPSGTLMSQEATFGKGKTKGVVKLLGAEGQELITAK